MKRTVISLHLAIAQILVVISWLLLQLHKVFYKKAREEINRIEDSR